MKTGQRRLEPIRETGVTIHNIHPLQNFRREERISADVYPITGSEDDMLHQSLAPITKANPQLFSFRSCLDWKLSEMNGDASGARS